MAQARIQQAAGVPASCGARQPISAGQAAQQIEGALAIGKQEIVTEQHVWNRAGMHRRRRGVFEPQPQTALKRESIARRQRGGHFHGMPQHQHRPDRHADPRGFLDPEGREKRSARILQDPGRLACAVLLQVRANRRTGALRGGRVSPVVRDGRGLVPGGAELRQQPIVQLHGKGIFPVAVLVAQAAFDDTRARVEAAGRNDARQRGGPAAVHAQHQHAVTGGSGTRPRTVDVIGHPRSPARSARGARRVQRIHRHRRHRRRQVRGDVWQVQQFEALAKGAAQRRCLLV